MCVCVCVCVCVTAIMPASFVHLTVAGLLFFFVGVFVIAAVVSVQSIIYLHSTI